MKEILLAFLAACSATAYGGNCPDPGFAARSNRFVSGRDDQRSTASHEPGDSVTYLCRYGPKDIMSRTTILKCQMNGRWTKSKPTCPLDEWGRCKAAGCTCDQATKTVSCRATKFPDKAKFFPSDTVKLSMYKIGRVDKNDYPGGIFDNLKSLTELNVATSTDAETRAKGWRTFMSLGYILPVKNLKKFTLAGDSKPFVSFSYSYDKESPCKNTNCYAECGEPSLLNPEAGINNRDATRTLYAFYFDLGQLDNVPGHTTVHAQTVHFNKVLNLPGGAKWTIIAREFYTSYNVRTGPFFFPGHDRSQCTVQLVTPGTHGKEKMMLLKHGPVTIYAERIRYWHISIMGCTYVPGDPQSVPRPSVDLSKAATVCAINLADRYPTDTQAKADTKKDVAMRIFNYVAKLLAIPVSRGLPGAELILSKAMQARERVTAKQKRYARYVPFLSKDVYENILKILYTSGQTYRDHLTRIESRSLSLNDGIASTNMMLQKSTSMHAAAKISYDHASDVLTVSQKTMENLKVKFLAADSELAERRKAFEKGIKSYVAKQTMKAVFGILKGIGSIVKGAFLASSGNSAGIGDIMIGIATIGETIMNVVSLVQRIKSMMDSNNVLMNSAKNLDSGHRSVSEYVTNLDEAANLELQIIYWDNMVKEVDELLGKGEVATIGGCAKYRLGLSALASWGKALTKETIRQTALVRDSLEKKAMLNGLQTENDRLSKSLDNARRQHRITEDMYSAIYFQAADVKLALMENLRQYCLSYFYYQLRGCSSSVRPKLSDSMTQLTNKVNTARIEALTSLANMKGQPQPYGQVTIRLTDRHGDNCANVRDCPVATFKKTRQLVFTIEQHEYEFATMQRVRIEEVVVKLVGARAPTGTLIWLAVETSGDFRDSYGSQSYNFTSAPFMKGFSYYYGSGKILMHAKVHSSQAKFFIETSPFTTWRFTMPNALSGGTVRVNKGVDISGLTAIELQYIGSSVSRSIFKKKR